MCLYPNIIRNPKYKVNKKNGGNVPVLSDPRAAWVPIGCGKCMECVKQKSNGWRVRLQEEIKTSRNAKFVTFSYSEESIELINSKISDELTGYERDIEIATYSVKIFREHWRRVIGKSPRYWLVTELGQTNTERLHLHGIIFEDSKEDIKRLWPYGNTWIGDYVNEKTINYIVKYVHKSDPLHKEFVPRIYASNGIGKKYIGTINSRLNTFKDNGETDERYTCRDGIKVALPTYYRNKLYTDEQREKLWLRKLDKKVRYVGGEKVDISKDDTGYYKALRWHRGQSQKLGYGDDKINWERKKYERDRRNMLMEERLSRDTW